jgi:hypothetical protein
MDDHKPLARGESSPAMSSAMLDEVPELLSDAASMERYRKTERQQAATTPASTCGRQPMGKEPT